MQSICKQYKPGLFEKHNVESTYPKKNLHRELLHSQSPLEVMGLAAASQPQRQMLQELPLMTLLHQHRDHKA